MAGYAIVVARFYEDLAERLIVGAQAALSDGGRLDGGIIG